MRNALRLTLLLVLFVAGTLSVRAGERRNFRSLAAEYERRDPIAEAKANFGKGEIYVFAAMGFGRYYPGVESEVGERVEKTYGVKYLGSTSDAVESKAHLAYMQAAKKFASAYNREIVNLLSEKQKRRRYTFRGAS